MGTWNEWKMEQRRKRGTVADRDRWKDKVCRFRKCVSQVASGGGRMDDEKVTRADWLVRVVVALYAGSTSSVMVKGVQLEELEAKAYIRCPSGVSIEPAPVYHWSLRLFLGI